MPFDLSYTLFYVSLGVSAVAVVLFLWLMREKSAPLPPGQGVLKASTTPQALLHPEGEAGEREGSPLA